ncbi:collagen alpha-1(I) chain-like [Loxodonta africana]|uniref:collagen alpha-1(I) chain-like n=1 Tax=Loxodonta africana TaxID=9785 RepID=UPI0030D1EC93
MRKREPRRGSQQEPASSESSSSPVPKPASLKAFPRQKGPRTRLFHPSGRAGKVAPRPALGPPSSPPALPRPGSPPFRHWKLPEPPQARREHVSRLEDQRPAHMKAAAHAARDDPPPRAHLSTRVFLVGRPPRLRGPWGTEGKQRGRGLPAGRRSPVPRRTRRPAPARHGEPEGQSPARPSPCQRGAGDPYLASRHLPPSPRPSRRRLRPAPVTCSRAPQLLARPGPGDAEAGVSAGTALCIHWLALARRRGRVGGARVRAVTQARSRPCGPGKLGEGDAREKGGGRAQQAYLKGDAGALPRRTDVETEARRRVETSVSTLQPPGGSRSPGTRRAMTARVEPRGPFLMPGAAGRAAGRGRPQSRRRSRVPGSPGRGRAGEGVRRGPVRPDGGARAPRAHWASPGWVKPLQRRPERVWMERWEPRVTPGPGPGNIGVPAMCKGRLGKGRLSPAASVGRVAHPSRGGPGRGCLKPRERSAPAGDLSPHTMAGGAPAPWRDKPYLHSSNIQSQQPVTPPGHTRQPGLSRTRPPQSMSPHRPPHTLPLLAALRPCCPYCRQHRRCNCRALAQAVRCLESSCPGLNRASRWFGVLARMVVKPSLHMWAALPRPPFGPFEGPISLQGSVRVAGSGQPGRLAPSRLRAAWEPGTQQAPGSLGAWHPAGSGQPGSVAPSRLRAAWERGTQRAPEAEQAAPKVPVARDAVTDTQRLETAPRIQTRRARAGTPGSTIREAMLIKREVWKEASQFSGRLGLEQLSEPSPRGEPTVQGAPLSLFCALIETTAASGTHLTTPSPATPAEGSSEGETGGICSQGASHPGGCVGEWPAQPRAAQRLLQPTARVKLAWIQRGGPGA